MKLLIVNVSHINEASVTLEPIKTMLSNVTRKIAKVGAIGIPYGTFFALIFICQPAGLLHHVLFLGIFLSCRLLADSSCATRTISLVVWGRDCPKPVKSLPRCNDQTKLMKALLKQIVINKEKISTLHSFVLYWFSGTIDSLLAKTDRLRQLLRTRKRWSLEGSHFTNFPISGTTIVLFKL